MLSTRPSVLVLPLVAHLVTALLFACAAPRIANAAWYTPTISLSESEPSDGQFGTSLATIAASNVAIGAPGGLENSCDYFEVPVPGVAYLFDGAHGGLIRTFLNPAPAAGDLFGQSLAAFGTKLAIGAPGDDTGALDAGSVYLFDSETGALLRTFQKPIVTPDDAFGYSVAEFDGNLLVGAPRDDTGAFRTGAVYLFDLQTGALIRRFLDPTPATGNQFGLAIISAGPEVIVGSPGDDANGENAGALHVFDGASGAFLRTIVNPPDEHGYTGIGLGSALAAKGNTILASTTPLDIASTPGGAYLFDVTTGARLQALLLPNLSSSSFRVPVALVDDVGVLGQRRCPSPLGDSSRVYLYSVSTGELLQTLFSGGQSLAILSDRIVAGAGGESGGLVRIFDPCGNHVHTAGEQCDDGNELDGDCCSSHCEITDNLCDDGIACTVGDECSLGECHGNSMTCSDGVVQADCNEQCDDGNLVGGDGCSASCKLEAGTATPTPTAATSTPTPVVPVPTPSGDIVPLGSLARKCQAALADQARAFAGIAHRQFQGCLDDILAGISEGKTSRLLKSCRKALDDGDTASLLARARAKILARVATKCRGIDPSEIGSTPCSRGAATTAEVALCLLDQHVASVGDMVRAEYGDVCGLLTFYDLDVGLPTFCMAP